MPISLENYKSTLNLPTTRLPMHADLPEVERIFLKHWSQIDLYSKIQTSEVSFEGQKTFVLQDGPPYANGSIHIGHALNKFLKDFILKSKRLSGFAVNYTLTWDCHGLPIELKVERIFSEKKMIVDALAFRAACRKYAQSQVEAQKEAFFRLGILADRNNCCKTMDFKVQASVLRGLAHIFKKNHLKKGTLPVYWCVHCQSALSDSEVEYREVSQFGLYVRFLALDQKALEDIFKKSDLNRISALIWTTVPWTLPVNQAIAVHPDYKYQLIYVEEGNDYLLLAKQCVSSIMEIGKHNKYEIVGECTGQDLLKLRFCHPFLPKSVPMITSTHVTEHSGTGLVHIAPAHGPEDFQIAEQWGLLVENALDRQGNFSSDHQVFPGENIQNSLQSILEILEEAKSLYAREPCMHRVACCWRHETQLIYLTTSQWFISMEQNGLREDALQEISNVKWHIAWGEQRMTQLLQARPDWCISRQRQWGNPLPLFVHKQTGELHPRTYELIQEIANQVEQKGAQIWWELPLEDFLGDEVNDYIKEQSVLDVWMDSGLLHALIEGRDGQWKPVDLYLEGKDQYRGWFMSSLLTSVGLHKKAPYREVLSHGFTVDEHGQKMSKSLGNVIDPLEIAEKKGADILRLWAANSDYRKEVSISDGILTHTQELYRRIRNTLRFLLSNLYDFSFEKHAVSPDNLVGIDQWALKLTCSLDSVIREKYEEYSFQPICKSLMKFCSIDLGSIYFSIVKDRLYVAPQNSHARRSVQTVFYHILQAAVRWISPILSFTAEEIWQHLPDKTFESVFLAKWWILPNLADVDMKISFDRWESLLVLRSRTFIELDQIRKSQSIRSPLDLSLTFLAPKSFCEYWQDRSTELALFFSVSKVHFSVQKEGIDPNNWHDAVHDIQFLFTPVLNSRCQRCWLKIIEPESEASLCIRCKQIVGGSETAYKTDLI